MADIYVDPGQEKLSVKIEAKSMQDVGYSIQLIGPNQDVEAECSGSLGSTADSVINALGITTSQSINGFINAIIDIADPLGADQNYNIEISVFQGSILLNPVITLTGVTVSGDVTRYPQFHINEKKP